MLGNNIKLLRNKSNLTIRELAENLDLNYSTLGMYETGRREPNNEILCKIADYFDVTTDMLLGRHELQYPTSLKYINVFNKAIENNLNEEDLEFLVDWIIKVKVK
jgi:transcriptional regulator with XRE-family HTH domain